MQKLEICTTTLRSLEKCKQWFWTKVLVTEGGKIASEKNCCWKCRDCGIWKRLFAVHCGAKVQCIVGSLLSGYCVPLRLPHQYAWRSTDVCVEELDATQKSLAVITAKSVVAWIGLVFMSLQMCLSACYIHNCTDP